MKEIVHLPYAMVPMAQCRLPPASSQCFHTVCPITYTAALHNLPLSQIDPLQPQRLKQYVTNHLPDYMVLKPRRSQYENLQFLGKVAVHMILELGIQYFVLIYLMNFSKKLYSVFCNFSVHLNISKTFPQKLGSHILL